MASGFASALSGIGSFLGNQVSSAINSKRAWKYTQRAMALQDQYNRSMMKDYYSLNRVSLTKAGYNPLLAVPGSTASGASYSPSTMNADSDSGSQAVNSALTAASLKSGIENTKSQTEANKASSALAQQQAETEKAKRTQMEFQNSMLDVQKHLAEKDLSWYDRKSYSQLYNLFQQAENYKATSAIGAMNAQTARQAMLNDYSLGKTKNAIDLKNANTNRYNAKTSRYDAKTRRYTKSVSTSGNGSVSLKNGISFGSSQSVSGYAGR